MFAGLMAYGYLGIIFYMVLTGCGLPMPEEVAIIAGGALAANGQLHWGLTWGSLLIGALLGDSVMYFIGHHFGRRYWRKIAFGTASSRRSEKRRLNRCWPSTGLKCCWAPGFWSACAVPCTSRPAF